jgi:ABC-type cobalt transport system substrate-binding protein
VQGDRGGKGFVRIRKIDGEYKIMLTDDFTPRSIEFWTLIFVTEPLGQIIIYIYNPRTIENMTRWFEFCWNFRCEKKKKK